MYTDRVNILLQQTFCEICGCIYYQYIHDKMTNVEQEIITDRKFLVSEIYLHTITQKELHKDNNAYFFQTENVYTCLIGSIHYLAHIILLPIF